MITNLSDVGLKISYELFFRYYVAEGVRIYSQETWRQVTQGNGKEYVEEYIKNVVEYYIEATESDNHAVREAACACIAELGSKVSFF